MNNACNDFHGYPKNDLQLGVEPQRVFRKSQGESLHQENELMMRVTIVTPSFNQATYLEATICSVLEQDYPQIEYFIMDGGSSDGSLEIIQKYAGRLAGWVSEPDRGQTDAINKGFARASGEIIAWLNSDDTYRPGAVREAVQFLTDNPEVGMVYGDANFINSAGCTIGKFPAAQTNLRLLQRGYVHIPQQSAFFRADLWRKVAPLDPSFYFAMDYDLWVRLARLAPMVYVHRTWANFRLHGDAKTIAADERCWPEMLRVHYRNGGTFFSVLVAKYYLRKLLAPLINQRRRRRMQGE
jgi:glycosyltransferase involved in cell wall biosynthesis